MRILIGHRVRSSSARYDWRVMPRSERKLPSTEQSYGRIRKPTAPPTQVEKDRRRKIQDDLIEREAEEDLHEQDGE